MLFYHEDYRDILQERLNERHGRNPAYSLRAFARDLKISPSRLSEVLSRRHHLSAAMADGIGRRLALGDDERVYFTNLVESQTARTEIARRKARSRVLKFRFATPEAELRIDQFKAIADWHHFAILELFKTRGFTPDPKRIAKSLGLLPKTATVALDRLERLGFLERDGDRLALRRAQSFTDSDAPQAALLDFQQQILAQAQAALRTQTKTERVTLTAVAAIDRASLAPLRAEINQVVGKFVTENAKQADADHVYCLTVHLFKMDQDHD